MEYTGKEIYLEYKGKNLRLLNQSCPEWTHPYPYFGEPDESDATLHSAGCGIFAVMHLIDWVTGEKAEPCELADFSFRHGGRGDDGTDRPALLKAMQEDGRITKIGLHYDFDGLLNDYEALWQNMLDGGCALCNLRVGHIVAIVDHREVDGERQLLVIDSARDSVHPQVRAQVRGVVEGSQMYSRYINDNGVCSGEVMTYSMFWVPVAQTSDFNLLHKI